MCSYLRCFITLLKAFPNSEAWDEMVSYKDISKISQILFRTSFSLRK